MEVKESQAKMTLEVGNAKFHKWLLIEIFNVCWLRYVPSLFPWRDEIGRMSEDEMVEHEINRMEYSKVRRHELISIDNMQLWNCPSLSCKCIFSQNNIHTFQNQIHYSPVFPPPLGSLPVIAIIIYLFPQGRGVSFLNCYSKPQGHCLVIQIPNLFFSFLIVTTIPMFSPF